MSERKSVAEVVADLERQLQDVRETIAMQEKQDRGLLERIDGLRAEQSALASEIDRNMATARALDLAWTAIRPAVRTRKGGGS